MDFWVVKPSSLRLKAQNIMRFLGEQKRLYNMFFYLIVACGSKRITFMLSFLWRKGFFNWSVKNSPLEINHKPKL